MDVHCVYLDASVLVLFRASGRKGVSLHRVSLHVGTDLSHSVLVETQCHKIAFIKT